MMTKREFAHNLAERLKSNPRQSNIRDVAIQLLNNVPEEDADEILGYIEKEVGNIGAISEQFDNIGQITVMQQVHAIIAQAKAAKNAASGGGSQTKGK